MKSKLVIAFAAALGVAVTAALGVWQLSRAAQKLALHAAQVQQKERPPFDLRLANAIDSSGAWLHRPVRAYGQWLTQHTVYLENRVMAGQTGFYVFTPLALEGGGAVMVQRGWVARDGRERTRVPALVSASGAVVVAGRIAAVPGRLLELGQGQQQNPFTTSGMAIRHNLDLSAFATETGLALAPFTVLQTGPASEGLQRDWPEVASGVEKHYGYAAQWFALAALIAGLYVWFQLIAPRRQRR